MRERHDGATGLLIMVILVLVAVAVLSIAVLNRLGSAGNDHDNTLASLSRAAAALDAFAGSSGRLPCPADPTLSPETGEELPLGGAATCTVATGTIPWKTIGLRRDDAYDAWGRKISYRVYMGNAGSLTQPGGASMSDCDLNEAFPAGATPTAGNSGGLCKTTHDTTPAQFVAGKGLSLTDFGVAHNDVAYVLISHGLTGLGAYTASGVQLSGVANGAEKNNTKDTGPFTAQAFSNTDTGATVNNHFDDLVAYRTIADLAVRANLAARNWPDTILSSVTFDRNTLAAALGSNPGSDTGQTTIAFNNATVSAFNSGGAQDISFEHGGGDPDAIGGVSGGDGGLSSLGGEGLRIDFSENARQFAFTLAQFDDNAALHERVQLRFFQVNGATATLKGTMVESSCASNGNVTSFSVDACSTFNRVEVVPVSMTDNLTPSSFSLAEIRTCIPFVTCVTDLQPTGNICSSKAFTPCSVGTNDASVLTITLSNPGNATMTGTTFTDVYPAGMVTAAVPGGTNTCGGVATATAGGASLALVGGSVPANNGSCTVTINVAAGLPNAYTNNTGDVTTASSGTLASVSGNLAVLNHPAVSVSFAPSTIAANAPTVLTITLTNANATDILDVGFTDTYPAGLTNTATPLAATTCSGTLTAVANGASIALLGGTIPASGTCTVTVNVTSATIGGYANGIAAGALASSNAGANIAGASDTLTVN